MASARDPDGVAGAIEWRIASVTEDGQKLSDLQAASVSETRRTAQANERRRRRTRRGPTRLLAHDRALSRTAAAPSTPDVHGSVAGALA